MRIRKVISKVLTNLISKGDINWWANFVKQANEEDFAQGRGGISDPMRQHAWVNIAVMTIARNLARAAFELFIGDTLVERGPEYEVFTSVNPWMSRFQLWESTFAWMKMRGECIWMFEDGYDRGIPKEIYPMNPTMWHHRLAPDRKSITLWLFKPQGEDLPKTNLDGIPFLPDEIVHFKSWNPGNMWRGPNPLEPIQFEINQDYWANQNNTSLLRNNSVPDGLLSTERPVTEEQAKEIKGHWLKNHGGTGKKAGPGILGMGMKYQAIALTNADMEFLAMKKWDRATILAKFGVPPAVVGVKDDMTPLSGADTKEQMKSFWTLTLIPELKHMEDKLRTDFFGKFGSKVEGKFNTDDIPELQEDEDERYERYTKAVKDGLMTQNEARERLGFDEPVAWGDTWYQPMMLSPVDAAAAPPPNAPPPEKTYDKTYDTGECFELLQGKTASTKTYTEEYKTAHWKAMAESADKIEAEFQKALEKWFFNQRSDILRKLTTEKSVKAESGDWFELLREVQGDLLEDAYWLEQESLLKEMSRTYLIAGAEFTGQQLIGLFEDLGISVGADFTIYETGAIDMVMNRVNKGNLASITDTVRLDVQGKIQDAIMNGYDVNETAEQIRSVYNVAQNRAPTIARTEMAGAINDSRHAGFIEVGIKRTSWLSARNAEVRPSHQAVDGETIEIGGTFSNGLKYPNDPNGPADEIINCRCVALPEVE